MANSTLLLADDSVTIQKVVNLTFSGEGIDVVNVSDGNSAMDILREGQPDLVMVDVNLPGINGYEICEQIRSMDTGREIPVILLVGSFEPFDADEAQRVGATAHLTKPFESIASLVEMVHGYLGNAAPSERFEETAEYPTDADIVVSEASIPYVGGFEDETIEAESYGAHSGESEERPEAPEPFAEPEQDYGEFSPESVGVVRAEYPEEEPESAASEDEPKEYGFAGEETISFEPAEAVDEQPVVEAPEPVYEYHQPEPEPVPDEDEEPTVYEERRYEREVYHQRSIIGSVDDEDLLPPDSEFGRGLYIDKEDLEVDEEYHDPGATMRLDESDLLELPIDPAFMEVESEPSEAEETPVRDAFEETIRQEFQAAVPAEEPGLEISEEVIDEIARRVVAKLSDRAVREIAWEVVPEMAEMIIRKMTEQKLNE